MMRTAQKLTEGLPGTGRDLCPLDAHLVTAPSPSRLSLTHAHQPTHPECVCAQLMYRITLLGLGVSSLSLPYFLSFLMH